MMNREIPYLLEDRTGSHSASDFDDIYDRIFFRVAPSSSSPHILRIYDIGTRSTSLGHKFHLQRKPDVVLQFAANGALGTVEFLGKLNSGPMLMGHYLKKTSLFSGSLSRKFRASDGQEYKWAHRAFEGQEWSCLNSEDHIISHYDLRPPNRMAVGTSGNMFSILTPFIHLTLELLTSLTVMRHIAEHNL